MWWPSVRLALQTLRANPLRTTLSTLGIIMGAGSLAAVLSIGDGAEVFARQRLEREGMQAVVLVPKTVDITDGQRVPRQGVVTLGADEVAALAAEVGNTYGVTFARRGTVRWQMAGSHALRAAALTGRVAAGAVQPTALAAGRDLRRDEMNSAAPVALASYALAAAIDGGIAGAVGREILANGRPVRLVGVIAQPPGRGASS
jgi:ABC-type antimicrobial peptide transport system permease subunit